MNFGIKKIGIQPLISTFFVCRVVLSMVFIEEIEQIGHLRIKKAMRSGEHFRHFRAF